MDSEKFDVVVIGAGLGGLSAAGHLAKSGKKVLVLEHHTVPGGYAHEFRRGHYRFEVALHALDGAAPGGWAYQPLADLEILDQVEFERLDPFYTARFPGHEIVAHADPVAYEAELLRHFPEEAQGIRSLIDAMIQVYFDVRRFARDGADRRRPSYSQIPVRYPHMIRAMSQSWGEFMSQHIDAPKLQSVFSTLWAYYGLPPSQLNAATFIYPWVSYHLFGAYYPRGGSMAMSRAIEQTIKKYGGEIRYRQTVTRIEIVAGRATAVTTDKGLRVEADLIISNANPADTMLKFVGREHLPQKYIDRVSDSLAKPALSSLVVYLGLEKDLIAEGWPYHELFISETYDLDDDYAAMRDGRFEQAGLVISHYDQADPGCAPAGGSVVSITTLASWDYANQWGTGGNLENYRKNPQYLELKQAAGEALIERVAALIPGLRQAIKHVEIGTPITNFRYSLNPAGSIYGSEQTVDNMYINRLSDKTPIPNLFLAGAWVLAGGMSAALLSGQGAARRAQAYFDKTGADSPAAPAAAQADPVPDVPQSADAVPPVTAPAAAKSAVAPAVVPDVTLTAVTSQREINLREIGRPALLVFHNQDTAGEAVAVTRAVRQQYPSAGDLFQANIIDLRSLPRLFRKFADGAMSKTYESAAQQLPEGLDPQEYVIILPDWEGQVTVSFGLDGVDQKAGVVVLAADGRIVGVQQDGDLADAALAMVAAAR